jgi:hypothetical protein
LNELEERLPRGGLARGWINPNALRELLLRQVEGTKPAALELIEALGAAELEAVRFAGFRREVTAGEVTTDMVIAYDRKVLPSQVARALDERPAPARLPAKLPQGVMAMAAFRPESEASLAWLRHASVSDPRGPLRNLEFWMEQLEERTGRSLERDLLDHLGDQGWLVAFETEAKDTLEVAVVLEVRDAGAVEESLLELRGWLTEQASGRTLGFLVPRARLARSEGHTLHATTFWTLFGEVAGPVFTVTDDHAVLATGDRAVRRALELLEGKRSWNPVGPDGVLSSPPHEAVVLRAAALSPIIEALLATPGHEGGGLELVGAVSDLVSSLDTASLGVWYEGDALRLRGRVIFESR